MTLGFYFDMSRCTGCFGCTIACKDFKGLPTAIKFRRVLKFETGTFPTSRGYNYSIGCNHCDNPACVAQCPTGAMQKADDGTIVHDDETCIGCQTCVKACPYDVPSYREDIAIVQKCDACQERREAGQNPACVDACQMRALDFGDVDELKAKYGELVNELPFLPAASATNPNTWTKPKEAALTSDFREYIS